MRCEAARDVKSLPCADWARATWSVKARAAAARDRGPVRRGQLGAGGQLFLGDLKGGLRGDLKGGLRVPVADQAAGQARPSGLAG
ncbi:hypothetical protein [Streptomyces purpurogeneiscleroticus]|uniref:hypothetical protein n=1 Tax=Streptomyces purpurogeneiscleroticus TaxID=68259 RepID=UPI001CBF0FEE|nr:hypothetical protein [Streptomyces purpurogeneiscleroticus]